MQQPPKRHPATFSSLLFIWHGGAACQLRFPKHLTVLDLLLISIMIGGVERHLLFTFSAIDLIQDHFDLSLVEVIQMLRDERKMYKVAGYIISILIQDEISRNGGKGRGPELMEVMQMLDLSMTKRVLSAILRAYGISMPELSDEEDDLEDPEQLNIARMIYIGTSKLGYTEAEILDMTPRKFHKIYYEYLEMNGGESEKTGVIDRLP